MKYVSAKWKRGSNMGLAFEYIIATGTDGKEYHIPSINSDNAGWVVYKKEGGTIDES